MVWRRPVMSGAGPAARGGHSVTLVGNLLVVFGGHYYAGENKFKYLSDVWAVDVDTMTWHNPRCAGGGPDARYGHTCTVVDYTLYVFGGKGEAGLFNDIWALDVETWGWTRLPSTTAPPPPRFQHSQFSVGKKVVFFGGWNGRESFNDLWVYDIDGRAWMRPKVSGPAPCPRHGHSTQITEDGRVLVFGGWAWDEHGRPQYLNDVRQLDTETMIWGRCRVTGEFPPGRYFHSTAMFGDLMVVFGGYSGERKAEKASEKVKAAPGASREALSVSCKSPHLYLLDTVSMEWVQPAASGPQPGIRYGHGMAAVGASLVVVGGWDGSKSVSDCLQLDLSAMLA